MLKVSEFIRLGYGRLTYSCTTGSIFGQIILCFDIKKVTLDIVRLNIIDILFCNA